MIPKHIQPLLDDLAEKYSKTLFSNAQDILSRDEFKATGELVESLRVVVTKCTDTEPPGFILYYAEQGFYLSYKSPKWVKVPNIDKLKAWAETANFSGPVPGYSGGASSTLPPWKIKERIVAAIAYDKRRNDTWKAKPWKGKRGINLGDMLSKLNADTLAAWAKEVETALVSAIETGRILS